MNGEAARGARRLWLPYVLPGERPLAIHVDQGKVVSTIGGRRLEWRSLGDSVSGIVATQDGRYIAARSDEALVIGRVDTRGGVRRFVRVPMANDHRLIAALHRPARSVREHVVVEVIVSTETTGEIWAINEAGVSRRRPLTGPLRSAAATADGFLVVGSDGKIAEPAPEDGKPTILSDLGQGWFDVDAAVGPNGPVIAGLRRVGGTSLAACATTPHGLGGAARAAEAEVEFVSVNRRLDGQSGPADLAADVWLISGHAHAPLSTRPLARERVPQRATDRPATVTDSANRRWDVFLSYSSTFTDAADQMYALLEERGLRVWYARNQHVGPWRRQIIEGIEKSRSYVVMWGPGSDREFDEIVDPADDRPYKQLSEVNDIRNKVRESGREIYVYLIEGHPGFPKDVAALTQLTKEGPEGPSRFANQVKAAFTRWMEDRQRDADRGRLA
jgi:hypothetical protein